MRRVLLKGAGCLVLAVGIALSTGCNVIGAIGNKMAGEQKAPALYKLPKTDTLVFVESFQNPDLYAVQAQQLMQGINEKLTENKAATVVSPSKVDDLRTKDRTAFSRMDIPSIARAVGAKQVIYVNIVKFHTEIPIAGTQYSGEGDVRVKVFDAETGRMLWPPDTSAGREIRYENKPEEDVDPRNPGAVQDQIIRHLSARVGEIFYDSVPDEPDTSGP